jgi:ABC-type nitrate/sulfonate/bicarbonate transport system permease component
MTAVSSLRSRPPSKILRWLQSKGRRWLTSTLALLVFLGIWQVLCMGEGATLPPPNHRYSRNLEPDY